MQKSQTILVTGGAGYIGSHTCVELLENNFNLIIIDNFSNCSRTVFDRIKQITNNKSFTFYNIDLATDLQSLKHVFRDNPTISTVIHFAGLKAVGESVHFPLKYYENNLRCVFNLLNVMSTYNCSNFIFSSSATVYGQPNRVPIRETDAVDSSSITNPYGKTKFFIEEILRDFGVSRRKQNLDWKCVLLRYFNPVGAHSSGLIGEHPNGIPNNLMPYISQVAVGKLKELSVFGNDYDTEDGTGVRDYIHVVDLARGHLAALRKIYSEQDSSETIVYNLGSSVGVSVLEMVKAMEKASGKKIPYKICERREGDIATCYADASKALNELNQKCEYNLERMAEDTWNQQSKNPCGYCDDDSVKNGVNQLISK